MAGKITPAKIKRITTEAAVENPYSTLDAAGNRMWERSYNRNLAAGEDPKGAAIHAWMHVRKFYRKDPRTGMWVKRGAKKRAAARKKPRTTPRPTKRKAKRTPRRKKNPVSLKSVMSRALS